ncbi:hypothetical protein [Alkalimonas amylolytica]|uniref:Lipoprotein n=1 Tax=Alkalimonas amylolytica TaxID=152573 RepID=A0A1H4FMB2_ALKAM|nr:hypothetical protein [Alkalimonas amylolytica]SEA98444.1 hypothetical protein SAMN04488051_11183 [Alkalimonas amylolytica]
MRVIPIFFIVLLVGCSMPPKTADEFKTSRYAPLKFEADLKVDKAFQLLIDEYAKCYQVSNSTMIPVGGAFIGSHESKTVEASQLTDRSYQIAVKRRVNFHSWYERMIELLSENGTQTKITVYQLPAYDSKNKTTIERFLSGEKVSICEN